MKRETLVKCLTKFFTQHNWAPTHTHTHRRARRHRHTHTHPARNRKRIKCRKRNRRKCTLNQCFFWPLLHFRSSSFAPSLLTSPAATTWNFFLFSFFFNAPVLRHSWQRVFFSFNLCIFNTLRNLSISRRDLLCYHNAALTMNLLQLFMPGRL